MTLDLKAVVRLQFLVRVVDKECRHLAGTDRRLFQTLFTRDQALRLDADAELAERVEAFVGRFGRLQDTVGDKLLPALLAALGEPVGAAVDNLDRAERLGLLDSTDDWLAMRALRNQMVHEYVEDPEVLAAALRSGHDFVAPLINASRCMVDEIRRRGWAPEMGTESPKA